MKQFEYKVIAPAVNLALTTRQYEQQAQELENLLNTLGAEGWELVQKADGFYFFKRNPPLRNNSRIKTACPQVRFMPERTGCSCFTVNFTAWAAR